MRILYALSALTALLLTSDVQSQCSLIPVDLDSRVNHSELIVEGTVIAQEGFRNEIDDLIYTANIIKVHKSFKGEEGEEIVIITPGGRVDNETEVVTPSLQLKVNQAGTFFLKSSSIDYDAGYDSYNPYSGPQGCIYYDRISGEGNDAFNKYNVKEGALYSTLENKTGNSMKIVSKFDFFLEGTSEKSATAITDFSPQTTTAGTRVILTLKGREFGNEKGFGSIEFRNGNTGSTWTEPVSKQIKEWTDTLIRVEIPTDAATGNIRVRQNGTAIQQGLTILYSQLNYYNQNDRPNPVFHKDNDGNGGFIWRMSENYHNDNGARTSFERALESWSSETCINWENGAQTTTNRVSSDGINIVRFADSGELPNGVLARTRNYYQECSAEVAFTIEVDMSYNPDIDWYTGTGSPGSGEYDNESVSVHELGHAHQLGHVRDGSDFMNPTIGPGSVKRDLVVNNIDAGINVMKTSAVQASCGPDPMTPKANCDLAVGLDEEWVANEIKVYPFPASDVLFIENVKPIVTLGLFDMNGQKKADILVNHENVITWQIPDHLNNGLYLLNNLNTGRTLSKVLILR